MRENSVMEIIPSIRNYFFILFFTFTAFFMVFSLLLSLLRRLRPTCDCHICEAYLNSTWKSEFDNLVDWYAHLLRSSPTGTIHVHILNNTITANPSNVEYMLTTHFDNFPKGKSFAAILGDLLGNGIFNVDGHHWQLQRKIASLELGSVSVRSHAFNVVSTDLRQNLLPMLGAASGRSTVDLQDVFRCFSFETICKISFGIDSSCLNLPLSMCEFAAAFDKASSLSAWRGAAAAPLVWKLKRLLNVGSERELQRAISLIDSLAGEIIRQRRNKGFRGSPDLLSRFMSSVDDDKYLRDIVVSFLLAGRDTIASSLTSFFFLLSKHPEIEAAIFEEISRLSSGGDVCASYQELRGMHYVHAALYENMRLYPPVQFDSKFCLEDDVLPDGTFVRAGTRVTYHPYAMGRMESVWGNDCMEFRPERWLRPDGEFRPESAFKYPVFQGGHRVCLGKEMAIMEMKAVIVAVVREFKVEVLSGDQQSLKFLPGLTATVSGGLPAVIRRRMAAC